MIQQGLFPKRVKHRKSREPRLEWIDPETDEHHVCPIVFGRICEWLGRGQRNARLSVHLLAGMGLVPTARNERHLRKAIEIFRRKGVPIVSHRSARGGYFIAETVEELENFCSFQERMARSILSGVSRIRASFYNSRKIATP